MNKFSKSCFGEYEVWKDIYNSNINVDILVYSSSRAWLDINPKILEDSLNLKVYNIFLEHI